jgi:hypothetical protein
MSHLYRHKHKSLFLQLSQASLIVCGDWRGSACVYRFSIIGPAPVMALLLFLDIPSLNVESGALCLSKLGTFNSKWIL